MGSELEVRDDLYVKISYGIVGSAVTVLMGIGIWVGTHAARLANVEARQERTVSWIKETNISNDKRFETLDDRVYQIWTEVVPPEKRKQLDQ
jgi:hypothetical protein